jgi:DNA polymerase-3 subunit epsilon
MHWTERPIHFIDFEGSRSSGILEFGVVTLRSGEITEVRTRFCPATGRIPPEDAAVHGLKAEELAHEAPFTDEWEYFCGLRARGPFAAHYASAEHSMIKSIWPYPRTGADFARPGRSATDWGPWIDTARLYEQLIQGVTSMKLETIVVRQNLQAELDLEAQRHCPPGRAHYHCALYDALAGAVLLRTLLLRTEYSTATIAWLYQMSTADADKREALRQTDLF